MNNNQILHFYPFLKKIPLSILEEIDLNCLHIPTEEQINKISELEIELQCSIVIYKKGYEPVGRHLCKTINSANLDAQGSSLIKLFESEYLDKSQIAVAYENPVEHSFLRK